MPGKNPKTSYYICLVFERYDGMCCFFADKAKALACFTLVSWLDQHKSVKKKKVSYCIADLELFGDGSTSIIFEHGQYKEYLRSSFTKHVVTGVCSHGLHVFFFFSFCSRFVVAVLTATATTTLLCEFYLCLPHSGSPQVELFPHSLSCGFASDGARRTSWRPSWRGGADPGWRSAPLKWWERRKRAPGPGTRERCCTQSLWQCWGSLGALPAASSPERSAKWKHAFSCGKEDGRRKGRWWVLTGIGCV